MIFEKLFIVAVLPLLLLIETNSEFLLSGKDDPIIYFGNLKVYTEIEGNKKVYYAENLEYCPMSFKMKYMGSLRSKMNEKIEYVVVPEKQEKFMILSIENYSTEDEANLNMHIRYGNVLQKEYDKEYGYTLPYELNSEYEVTQSSNGGYSHDNKHAYDFKMPLGTPIHAARSGVVVRIGEKSDRGCSKPECSNQGNFVTVLHDDGTFASYYHLFKNGALVSVGDKVDDGQLIGFSGNTGWSTGPHLHFEVYLPRMTSIRTIRPKFKIKLNAKPRYLTKNQIYKRSV